MAKVTPQKLLHLLEGLIEGKLYHRVTVDETIAAESRIALNRMLELG